MTVDTTELRKRITDKGEFINKSWYFCLPFLADSSSDFINLRGCFVGAEDYPELDSHIFCLFLDDGSPEFKYFLAELEVTNDLEITYKPDDKHVMMVFKPHPSQMEDYHRFWKGEYSYISVQYKQQIILFHGIKGSRHKLVRALFKQESLRLELMEELDCDIPKGAELLSVPEASTEIFSERILAELQ